MRYLLCHWKVKAPTREPPISEVRKREAEPEPELEPEPEPAPEPDFEAGDESEGVRLPKPGAQLVEGGPPPE